MSVGVESIDNDHKMLLKLINEISDAIEHNQTAAVIEDVFQRLEIYVTEHFTREEALMRQCNYPDLKAHIKEHRKFTAKVPELKRELLSADSTEVAAEINLFLFNWLMNHIVGEDMCFAQLAHDSGLSNQNRRKPSRRRQLINWLGSKLTLGRRIFLTALIPIMGVCLLSILILWISVQRFHHVQQLLEVTGIINEISDLTHQLQIERGLSTGLISSGYRQFGDALFEQRQHTDATVSAFEARLRTLPEVDPLLATQLQLTTAKLAQLQQLRQQTDAQTHTASQNLSYYSSLISSLQKIPEDTLKLQMGSELVHAITAYTAMLHLKESAGVQRALGTQAIAEGRFTADMYQQFAGLIGEQRSYLKVFQQFTSAEQQNAWQPLFNGPAAHHARAFEAQIYTALKNDSLAQIDSTAWFDVMTQRIEQLKILSDQLGEIIDTGAEQQVADLKVRLYITAAILLVILSLTILVSWLLNRSVIEPVQRITRAMARLAEGRRDLRFTDRFAHDELGRMTLAYEQCRRSLLRADVSSTVSNQRQNIELQARIREKERFRMLASTDPLTGALNRRKFSELATEEIDRCQRYDRPLSVMMLDLDLFKQVNDSYGHAAGDEVLRAFYHTCHNNVRSSDKVSRLGGEEFAILLPETNREQATELAERIRIATSQLVVPLEHGSQIADLSVSIGVTAWADGIFNDIQDMLEMADQALYQAKERGRNRVVCSLQSPQTQVTPEAESLADEA